MQLYGFNFMHCECPNRRDLQNETDETWKKRKLLEEDKAWVCKIVIFDMIWWIYVLICQIPQRYMNSTKFMSNACSILRISKDNIWMSGPLITWSYMKHDGELMMTSSNGNIFRVTGHLCGEFTGHRWIPPTKASDTELWRFLWSTPE